MLTNTIIMAGVSFTTNVSTSGGPVENAMVALSQGDLFYRGITDATGNVTIDHGLNPGTAKLVVTGFNTETIYEDVNVIPPNGPYISVATVTINDAAGNNNGLLDYGETVYLTVGLCNVGTADANNVAAYISTSDEFMRYSMQRADFGTIPARTILFMQQTDTRSAPVQASPTCILQLFMLDATGSSRDTWSSSFAIAGHAPMLADFRLYH